MPRSRHFESQTRQRRTRALAALVAALALLVGAGATGVARADGSPTAADDQYNQQPVLTPPTNTPTTPSTPAQQPAGAVAPASQNSPPAVTPPAQTPAAAATTPASTPSTPAATQTPAAPKSTPQKPFTPPTVSSTAPAQTPTQSAAPASGTQGQSLPFTGIPLFDVVLVGLGLIALGAVLRLPQSRLAKRS